MERMTMTVADLQQALGIGRRHAYELVNRADFPTIRLGKKIVIPRDAFMRWLDKQTAGVLEGNVNE